ncbi:hypothetical protein FRB99_007239 [Tulasnella sp. 403]|nr:hypothetical protein FRB99_007239 [Tulasnella sp. 403]
MNTKAAFFALLAFASSTAVAASADAHGAGLQQRAHHNLMPKHAGHVPAGVRNRRRAAPSGGKKARCAAKNNSLTSSSQSSTTTTTSSTKKKEDPTPTSTPPPPPPPEPTTTSKKHTSTKKQADPTPTPKDNGNNDGGNGGGDGGNGGGGGGGGQFTGDGTFYTPGLNACGTVDGPNSRIAAVSHELWDTWPGFNGNSNDHPLCHKSITAHYQGKSTTVQITDRCGGCETFGALDFSPDAFQDLASFDVGRIHGLTWSV